MTRTELNSSMKMAEKRFLENVDSNHRLAKYRTKIKKSWPPRLKQSTLMDCGGLTPAELCSKLAQHGVSITDRTLRNYVKAKKISPPRVENLGDSLGKRALYQCQAFDQILLFKGKGGSRCPQAS